MRRLILVVVAVGMVMIPSNAGATGARDYAKGSGSVFTGAETSSFSFNAWSDPANFDAEGSMKFESGGTTYYASVTCLRVLGNAADMWGDVTHTSGAPALTFVDQIRFRVFDGDPTGLPDTIIPTANADGPPLCTDPVGQFPLTRGEITVYDE